jgi:hypothetical protein
LRAEAAHLKTLDKEKMMDESRDLSVEVNPKETRPGRTKYNIRISPTLYLEIAKAFEDQRRIAVDEFEWRVIGYTVTEGAASPYSLAGGDTRCP